MLPSAQNKKQKRKLFLQFVFSYCKVLLNTARWRKLGTSVVALTRTAELTVTDAYLPRCLVHYYFR